MAYIYEINGQRVEFEKEPTEKDIDEAAKNLTPVSTEQPLSPGDIAATQGVMSGARVGAQTAYDLTGGARDLLKIGKNVAGMSPQGLKEVVTNPLQTAKAYVMGHPFLGQGVGGMAQTAAGKVLAPIAAPENLFTAPYSMAAYEQEKIRQNPNAPGLEYNPYAQVQRGEAQTQGQAAAANQMRSVANMPYGNVSPQERRILDEDRMMRQNIRKKAYEKVMGPVVPGSF